MAGSDFSESASAATAQTPDPSGGGATDGGNRRPGEDLVYDSSVAKLGPMGDALAEVIRYNVRRGSETSLVTTWLAEAAGQIVAISFYADPEDPVLYTELIDEVLATAEFQS